MTQKKNLPPKDSNLNVTPEFLAEALQQLVIVGKLNALVVPCIDYYPQLCHPA